MPAILLIGLEPTLVDFSTMPGMSAEIIQRGLDKDVAKLRALGYDATWLLTDLGETAEQVTRTALGARRYDAVLIGAGLRLVPPYLRLFEKLVNLVHRGAPDAAICFNSNPADTAEAVVRWVPMPAKS